MMNPNLVSHKDLADVLSFVNDCVVLPPGEVTNNLASRIGSLLPVDGIAAVVAEMGSDGDVHKTHVVNINYPAEWIDIYERCGYAEVDPVVQKHFSTFALQKWSETFAAATSCTHRSFLEEAKRFGLVSGLTAGIRDVNKMRASLFSFCGAEIEEDPRHLTVLKYIIPHLHEFFFKSTRIENSPRPEVSFREKDVLKWVKYGKTNWEIGQILMISERTVKFHLKNLAVKFNAHGRSHIVAVALSMGIIEF
jgi:DNA-binding CsgD family transcriptional regulator